MNFREVYTSPTHLNAQNILSFSPDTQAGPKRMKERFEKLFSSLQQENQIQSLQTPVRTQFID